MDELKAIIRSLAISSASGITLSQLDHDFKSLEGYSIPYKNHGFKSLLSMLRTLTDVVQIKGNDQQSTIHPVATEKNQHIRSMVEKSKKSKKKKTSVYSPPMSSSHEPERKASTNAKQCYNSKPSTGTQQHNSKSSNWSQRNNRNGTNVNPNAWRTNARNRPCAQNDYSGDDYYFHQFMNTLRDMLTGTAPQNGQHNWNGGTPNNCYYPTPNMPYHNNQQCYENYMRYSFNAWNYNNAGWNYNQAAPQQRHMNNYPPVNGSWNGHHRSNWVGNNNMFFNNSMGYSNNGGGYPNQYNCGMANNMNVGYNNNYPRNGYNNNSNNYDLSMWNNAYAPYYSQ
uniref:HTH OST-type domain-containing protein n=1 Tax=Anopheles funestus TaxID=62324 RepID=A0A182RJB3_ANOFN